jgi:DNA-binding YbaB/EbfC family protein
MSTNDSHGFDEPRPPLPGMGDDVEVTGIAGMSGLGDLGGLLESAQEALAAQAEAANEVVEGSAGGGVVRVTMSGTGEVQAVTIDPEVVDPDEVEMLQDLVVAALHDATAKVAEIQRQALGAFGGFDIGGLGGLGGPSGGPAGLGPA